MLVEHLIKNIGQKILFKNTAAALICIKNCYFSKLIFVLGEVVNEPKL